MISRRWARRCALLTICASLVVPAPGWAASSDAAKKASNTAKTSPQITISPTVIDVDLKPGEKHTFDIQVAAGNSPVGMVFEHVDLGYTPDTYEQQFIPDDASKTTEFSTRGWMTPSTRTFSLKRNGKRTVELRIAAPTNATPGTHLGAALFRTVSPVGQSTGPSVSAAVRTGPIVIVRIVGGSDPKPRLAKFSSPKLIAKGPGTTRVSMDNTGASHFYVEGTVTLKGRGQVAVANIPRRMILPGLARDLAAESGTAIKLGSKKLPIGRYTLQLRLKTDPGALVITHERTIWIIPVWLRIVVLIAGLGALLALLLLVRRIYHARLERIGMQLVEHDHSDEKHEDEHDEDDSQDL